MTPLFLNTERLTLKPLSILDAEAFYIYRSDPKVSKYQGFCPYNISEACDFIQTNTSVFNNEDTWFQVGVYREQKLVGDIGIHFMGPNNSQCELGYTLACSEQRKGYGQEAVNAVIGYLFGSLNKHRITAALDPRNSASEMLLKRLGFRREAFYIKGYFNNGVWEDELLYALLNEEWGKTNKGA